MKVPTEEIMLIGATNASGTGGGNTPIRQGSLKSPAPISSVIGCELLTNGTLVTVSNQTLGLVYGNDLPLMGKMDQSVHDRGDRSHGIKPGASE